jgi:NAD(P) transhydrogenase
MPASLTILGAGVIGCEYACMFAALGVKVTLVDARDALLASSTARWSRSSSASMRRMGIELRLGARWSACEREGDNVVTRFARRRERGDEQLLYAAGAKGARGPEPRRRRRRRTSAATST